MANSILIVAPYKKLAQTATRVLRRLNLEIPVVIGNDSEGISQVKNFENKKILISRGGTSRLLAASYPDRTLIDLRASFADISRGIEQLIAQGCTNIAVITHDNIIGMGASTISFGAERVQVIPCSSFMEIEYEVENKAKEGIDGVVGCFAAVKCAKSLGLKACFIDTDISTIEEALLKALTLDATFHEHDEALELLHSLIGNLEEGIIIFEEHRRPSYFNEAASKIFYGIEQDSWFEPIEKYLYATHRSPHVVTINQRQCVLRTVLLPFAVPRVMVIMQEGRVIEQSEKAMRTAAYAKGLYAKTRFDDLLLADPTMRETAELAQKYALSDSTILISGETGVGKEGFAQSIHNASLRSHMPFVSVNCASLPQGLIASELFGYVEGAFTGARQEGKKGLFELAQGGTIFLDEITEIPLEVQGQFLRVLQEREVMRVGDDRLIPLDIRVICACNKNILPLCEEGRFRYDLYYRINVLKLRIPPLKQRPLDIIPLFKRFMSENLKGAEAIIEPEAEELLLSYDFPGNVRELRNIAEICSFHGPLVKRTVLESCLNPDQLEQGSAKRALTLEVGEEATAGEVVKAYLKKLNLHHSLKETVKISGLSRTTVWRKLNEE